MPLTATIKKGQDNRPFYVTRILMRGRPGESASWESISCYSEDEFRTYLNKGWRRAAEFMDAADAARKDTHP